MTRTFSTYEISKEEAKCLDRLKIELSFFLPRFLNDQALYESALYKYHKRIEAGEIQYDIKFLSSYIQFMIPRIKSKYIKPLLHYLLIYKSKLFTELDDLLPICHLINACLNRPQTVNKSIKEYAGAIKLYNYDIAKVLERYLTIEINKGE